MDGSVHDNSDEENLCSICLMGIKEEDLAILTPCEHKYCMDCIRQQAYQSLVSHDQNNLKKCAQCRQDVEFLTNGKEMIGFKTLVDQEREKMKKNEPQRYA